MALSLQYELHLQYVDRNTPLDLTFHRGEEVLKLRAAFVDNLNNTVFYVRSPQIYDQITDYTGETVGVSMEYRKKLYTFDCRIMGREENKMFKKVVALQIVSVITQASFISSTRIETTFRARIYGHMANRVGAHRGDFICDAQSMDVSEDGIGLLCDVDLHMPRGTTLTIDFSIDPDFLFSIPAKLMFIQKNPSSSAYAFTYGFRFDFSDMPQMRGKLITDIFKTRVGH